MLFLKVYDSVVDIVAILRVFLIVFMIFLRIINSLNYYFPGIPSGSRRRRKRQPAICD